jgi:hypothetical protein
VITAIEDKVGRDGYVLAVTADHGMPNEPDVHKGQTRAYTDDIIRLIHERFDPLQGKLVKHYEPENMQIAVDRDRLRELGLDLGALRQLLEAQPYVFAAFTDEELGSATSLLERSLFR